MKPDAQICPACRYRVMPVWGGDGHYCPRCGKKLRESNISRSR